MDQQITEPAEADVDHLARCVLRVTALVQKHLERELSGDETDLDALQALLDTQAIGTDATKDLECMGCVLGMRLVNAVPGLDWAIVEDEHGREAALRYLQTSLLVFPVTMIARRVEDGETVDVRRLFEQTRERLEVLKGQVPQEQ